MYIRLYIKIIRNFGLSDRIVGFVGSDRIGSDRIGSSPIRSDGLVMGLTFTDIEPIWDQLYALLGAVVFFRFKGFNQKHIFDLLT